REVVLTNINETGNLSDALKTDILSAETKTRLEDLYRPFVKKRRTKGQIAREAGLDVLAFALFETPTLVPESTAADYLNPEKGITDTEAALLGARHILMEYFAEDATLLAALREYTQNNGKIQSQVIKDKAREGAKFSDYFDFSEALKTIPSHRALALFRGQKQEILRLSIVFEQAGSPEKKNQDPSKAECMIASHFEIKSEGRPADAWLWEVVRWTWRVKLSLHLDLEMKRQIRERSEETAIKVFARNLYDLLLAAPAGPRVTMGLDPGIRTGIKVAVIDGTGKLLDTATLYAHAPRNEWDQSIHTLSKLCAKYGVELISIGNGTASRETDQLVADLIQRHPELHLKKMIVSEAGASVYSASAFASREFPDLDVSLRGAVSIARRLQDPLAELVKIDAKAIGVGQYQHDVNQVRLSQSLAHVVEDGVNAVGVDLNTASAPLLSFVSGLSPVLAQNIVAFRDENGPYKNRKKLMKVPRLGPKCFEQCAGFLRVMNGENKLDASTVHPEAYSVVERIAEKNEREIDRLIGDAPFLRSLQAKHYIDAQFGEPTVCDILLELEKPGRDPRPEFKMPQFKIGIEKMSDLKADMQLEGVVSNVTNFGAFVDIGVHQDGLVHISQLADRYVSDPHKVVKAGDIVKVKVQSVDLERKRIALTMRTENAPSDKPEKKPEKKAEQKREQKYPKAPQKKTPQNRSQPSLQNAMAAALAKAGLKKK
ncbi:MAG: RNA-binding transcriptional accessory protein, partial [Nitrospirae bacterium]|nr:RNA-binding transcriptional accessory protein [Candidatus Manganitrophaceae bacterium]